MAKSSCSTIENSMSEVSNGFGMNTKSTYWDISHTQPVCVFKIVNFQPNSNIEIRDISRDKFNLINKR